MARPRKKPPLLDQLVEGTNRRIFSRKELCDNVTFEDEMGDPLFVLKAANVSVGGIYLQDGIPLKIGSRAFLSFRLEPATQPIRLVGEVVRVEKKKGMGVLFVEVPETARHSIEIWLAQT